MGFAGCTSPLSRTERNALGDERAVSLLLVAHGSRLGDDAAAKKLVMALSADFAEVAWSVLRGRPTPQEVLAGMSGALIHVVPMLMACGEIGGPVFRSLLPTAERSRLRIQPPVGAHPGLASLICVRVKKIVRDRRFALRDTAVILVGHGSARNPAPAIAIHRLGSLVRARGCCTAELHCAFLSQSPLIEGWRGLTRCRNVIVIPCFLTTGTHVQLDLPAHLYAAREPDVSAAMRQLWVAPHLGAHWRGLAALIRDSVLEPAVVSRLKPISSGTDPDAYARS